MDEKLICDAIQKLTHYSYINLEKRANSAIKKALQIAKKKGYTRLFIPDEGGWITYKQFGEKLKFDVILIKTHLGIINPSQLKLEVTDVILIHTLAGYHSTQPTKEIRAVCDKTQSLFIEDCCGAPHITHYGHIIVCSFGNAKPINFGKGGFFATNDKSLFEKSDIESYCTDELYQKILNVKERLHKMYEKREELREIYNEFHPIADEHGIVLIIPYQTERQKEKIISIAQREKIEYEECPRYIRTNTTAISLEIKRL